LNTAQLCLQPEADAKYCAELATVNASNCYTMRVDSCSITTSSSTGVVALSTADGVAAGEAAVLVAMDRQAPPHSVVGDLFTIRASIDGACPCADRSLCSALSPQPKLRREVVAFHSTCRARDGRDCSKYGANETAWRHFDWEKVTTVALFGTMSGTADDANRDLLCVAHSHGARVISWSSDIFGHQDPMPHDYTYGFFADPAQVQQWVVNVTRFVHAAGTDGVAQGC
jgi:hypothetical protein